MATDRTEETAPPDVTPRARAEQALGFVRDGGVIGVGPGAALLARDLAEEGLR